jgi:hypothetical protein
VFISGLRLAKPAFEMRLLSRKDANPGELN